MVTAKRAWVFTTPFMMLLIGCAPLAADPEAGEAGGEVAGNGMSPGAATDIDADGDGVTADLDCNDGNALIGARLYENSMASNTGYLTNSPNLPKPWVYGGGVVSNTKGGQQALLGQPELWANTVSFLTLSADGSMSGCSSGAVDCTPERFRAGVLSRANVDADQDEGFQGYRCAVAANSTEDCYQPGPFVQLAAFLDAPEDDVQSECAGGCAPNPTFDQLDRANRSSQTDLLNGDAALLTFWAVGQQLLCTFDGVGGEHVETSAVDDRFASGGTGLSTLNALGDFDHLLICQAFGTPTPPADGDGDGVPETADCDDNDALVGALLYQNDLSSDTGYFTNSPNLPKPWVYDGANVSNTAGGQQALLGQSINWQNTVTYLTLSASGTMSGCSSDSSDCDPERFRAGVLARANVDADQDEGFHGYRCAVAVNAQTDCFEPGPFVQLGAFLDGPEDNINSECTVGCAPNPTFDQLDRANRSSQTNLVSGDVAKLTFWAVGTELVCAFDGAGGEHVVTSAVDDRFTSGGTGLSALNALGDFDHIKVCQAFGTP
jgi:hypothetical protein